MNILRCQPLLHALIPFDEFLEQRGVVALQLCGNFLECGRCRGDQLMGTIAVEQENERIVVDRGRSVPRRVVQAFRPTP